MFKHLVGASGGTTSISLNGSVKVVHGGDKTIHGSVGAVLMRAV
jgi:hypothetical protein